MGSVLYRWKELVNDLPTSFLCSDHHHENPGDTYTVQRVGYFRVAQSWVGLGFFLGCRKGDGILRQEFSAYCLTGSGVCVMIFVWF